MVDLKGLILKAGAGDVEAFSEIVDMYQDMSVGYAYSILGDYHYAQDAAQEAFVQAYLNIGRLKEANAFVSWLRRIIFSSCTRITRRRKMPEVDIDEAGEISSQLDCPEDVFDKRYMREQVQSTLLSLPEEQRHVVVLYYIKDYSYKQIAAFLDLPVSTITNRLHNAKQKIKKELFYMFEESVKNIRVSANDKFKKKVIEGISRIGFEPAADACPENVPLPSIMKACFEYMGENYGYKTLEPCNMRLSTAYTRFMGVSGAVFRFFWNWNLRTEDGGRIDPIFMSDDPIKQFERVFEAAGYKYELLLKKNYAEKFKVKVKSFSKKDDIKSRVVESIKDRERPVIALGVVGPVESSIITGYDEDGNVLIGWSYFQESENREEDFEPSGYFRKRDWFDDTYGIILIGDKINRPSDREVYKRALEWGIEQMKLDGIDDFPTGLNAYNAWAKDLVEDGNFPKEDIETLKNRQSVLEVTALELAERRWYGMKFFEQVIGAIPEMGDELSKAGRYFEEEHNLMWQILELIGSFGNPDTYKKLTIRETRERIAAIVMDAAKKDEKAIECIEKALKQC